jgi:hypothetical protein
MNFPASPSLNQTYAFGGVTYVWDGIAWVRQAVAGSGGGTVDASTLYYNNLYLRGRL